MLNSSTAKLGLIASGLVLAGCFSYPADQEIPLLELSRETLYAEHVREGRFFNPWNDHSIGLVEMTKFILSRNPFDTGDSIDVDTIANDGSSLAGFADPPQLTWVGHATYAIHDGDDVVLTDPHFSKRALVPARKFPPGVPIESIPADAFAVISHSHYDHLDAETVDTLPDSVQWFVPLGMADWFRGRGKDNVVELDWWQSAQRGRWKITCLPSQHWSRRFWHSENTMLWCSWLLDSGRHRYYFAGDTGYFHGFAEYGRLFAPIDVALLPIGAYEPRWFMAYQHTNPREAYRAFGDLGADYMMPIHWGTFRLTHEPVDQAAKDLRAVIEVADGDPARSPILAIGETWTLPAGDLRGTRADRGPLPR